MSKGFSNLALLQNLLSGPYQHYVEFGNGDWRDPAESNPALSLSAEGWFDHKKGTGGHLSSLAEEHILERHDSDSLVSRGVESECSLNDSQVKPNLVSYLWEELAQREELAIDFLKSYLTDEQKIPLANYEDLIGSGHLRYLPASGSYPPHFFDGA